MFILKQNIIYLNEHSFNAWLIVLQLYLGYYGIFFKQISNNYYIAFCNMHMQELG